MDHNQGSKNESMMSVESRQSNISNPKSLGRPSFQFPQINIQKKASLVYAMSIESDNRKSDIFERLLQSQKKTSQRPSSIINSQTNQYAPYQMNQFENQRNSQVLRAQNKIQIDHECRCYEECSQRQCPCFSAKNQICVRGDCCDKCVQMKYISLKTLNFYSPQGNFYPPNKNIPNSYETSYQNTNQMQFESPQLYFCNCKNTQCLKSYCKCFQNGQFCSEKCGCELCKNKEHSEERYEALQAIKQNGLTYCTCKKTKCNKKYCSCYAEGIKCGKHCSCENCTNCDQVNQMDLEVYEGEDQQDLKNAQMPEIMSFEPVNFQ